MRRIFINEDEFSVKCVGLVIDWKGWSGGAMVQGKLPVPGRPTYLE